MVEQHLNIRQFFT